MGDPFEERVEAILTVSLVQSGAFEAYYQIIFSIIVIWVSRVNKDPGLNFMAILGGFHA